MSSKILVALTDGLTWAAENIRGMDKRLAAIESRPAPKDGVNGRDGVDGVGVSSCAISDEGRLSITLTNGKVINLGAVVGKDGRDGKDGESIKGEVGEPGPPGKDGESIKGDKGDVGPAPSVDIETIEGGRTILFKFDLGDTEEIFEVALPEGPQGLAGERGVDGKDGKDGKDADMSIIESLKKDIEELRGTVADIVSGKAAEDDVFAQRVEKLVGGGREHANG